MDNIQSKKGHIVLLKPTLVNKLVTLFLAFFIMMLVVGLCLTLLGHLPLDLRASFMIGSCLQSVLVFIFPAFLTALLCSSASGAYLGLKTPVAWRQFIGVIILLALMMPGMNMIIEWNAGMSLPAGLEGLERTLREWEDTAADTTEMILGDTGWGGLISGVLIVGCLTGLAEEAFFRGGLQKAMMSSGVNVHVAVWIAALVFSAVHFQFFGFVPRLLLGACFGYLYSYTRSLWVPAFAHALNNSSVVVTAWLAGRGLLDIEIDKIGTEGGEAVWIVAGSVIMTAAFLLLWGRKFFRCKKY